MINAGLLILIVSLLSADGVFSKTYNKRTGNKGAFIFCAISCIAGCLYFLLSAGKLQFDIAVLPYTLMFAAAFATAILSEYMAFQTGPLSLSALALSYSLIIPTLFGVVYYHEKTSVFFFIGIVVMVISIFLVTLAKDEKKISLKWAVFAGLAFLGNGICSTVQNVQQRVFEGAYKNELMIMALAIIAVVVLIVALRFERGTIKECVKKGAILAVVKGASNGFMNFLVMVLSLRMAASLMYPMISVGSVLLSTAIAAVFFKERLSLSQNIGLGLGLCAIVLLNL